MEKYVGGFEVTGKSDYETVNWLFRNTESNENTLVFLSYDANLWPLPDFSIWKDESWKQKQITKAIAFTKDFIGEVWLDDVKIKG